MNFTIPATTPPGYYLVRVEHNNLSKDGEGTQFFIGCAHVRVIGPGGGTSSILTFHPDPLETVGQNPILTDLPAPGTPGPTIKLPEEYNRIAGVGMGKSNQP